MSAPFRLTRLQQSSVRDIEFIWTSIDLAPTYQRQSDIWSKDKRQLFIDSPINGFDIPKLYFHDLNFDPVKQTKRYAIIDGKQRLETIHAFIDGEFGLSEDFEDLDSQGSPSAGGLKYQELGAQFPRLKARFDRAELPIVLVQTSDEEFIDEMFSRLNEAVPLNAPEKRNALGGPLPRHIRRLVEHELFVSRMAFPNSRYRHLDLATKFLYIEYRNGLVDLKKRDLDQFVLEFKTRKMVHEASVLYSDAATTLDHLSQVFVPSDPLLASVGMITIYYELIRDAAAEGWLSAIKRDALVRFDDERAQNRGLVREAQELALEGKPPRSDREISAVLTAFERYVQSPNDAGALKQRLTVVRQFLKTGRIPSGK